MGPLLINLRLLLVPLSLLLLGLVVASAMVLPLAYLGIRAVGIGGEFLAFISSARILDALLNTAILTIVVTVLSALIAVPAAFVTMRTDLPARRFWSVAMALPLAIPSFVGSFAILGALAPRGSILQLLLSSFGVDRLPSIYGWPGAILALTLFTYPYMFLTTRAGLLGIDPAIEEAASTLGYGHRETFMRVTLPHMYPSIATGALLVASYVLSDFGTPSLMRFNSLTRMIYIEYQSAFDRSGAAVLGLLLVVQVVIILSLEHRARNRASYYSVGPGSKRITSTIKLGRWRWPAMIFSAGVTIPGLILPLAILIYWLINGVLAGEYFQPFLELAFNTAYVSSLALLIIPAALPVALLSVRFRSRVSSTLESLTYVGFAMPGIVVALSLVSFAANYATILYQSMGLLIFAYAILFIPLAVGTLRSSLLTINPQMEDVARSLGLGQVRVLVKITLPLARPGLLTAAALVMLTTMKELPATLLLAPVGFRTLATQVWSNTNDAFFAQAAVPAILLVAISALLVTVILSQERPREQSGGS